jgi:hypothetical protein
MRVQRLVHTFFLFLLLALPAIAHTTGASTMSVFGDQLRRELRQYTVEGSSDIIRVLDRESGAEVLSVRQTGPQQVAITATIGTYADMSREARSQVLEQIALFNFSSLVGTLTYDDRTGTVIMSHNLNPHFASMQQMVRVASLCGDVARAQASTLRQ